MRRLGRFLHREHRQDNALTTHKAHDDSPLADGGRDLWDEAYQRVISRDPDLGTKYDQALRKGQQSGDVRTRSHSSKYVERPTGTSHEILRVTVKNQLEAFELKHRKSSKWEEGLTVVTRMKAFVDLAASQEPHAAVAWAALSLLLPILLQPPEQHRDAIAILHLAADVIYRYGVKEEQLHLHTASQKQRDLQQHLHACMTDLYTSVLELQMRAVCQFARSGIHQYARDVFKADNWADMRKTIQEQDEAYGRLEKDLDASAARNEAHAARTLRVSNRLDVAEGAEYYSRLVGHDARRSCHPGTRVELLASILQWAEAADAPPIFWLRGWAGTGKSTIARTVAENLQNLGYSVASFFFRRDHHELSSVTKLLSTLASQLANHDTSYCQALDEALRKYTLLGKSAELAKQYKHLILEPLQGRSRTESTTLIIVLDALDECEKQNELRSVLGLISNTADLSRLRVRIFLTSREEPDLVTDFAHMPSVLKRELILQDLADVKQDIMTYLEHRLRQVQLQRRLPPEWPTREQIYTVAQKADGLFIFVETVCRYVDVDPLDYDPRHRLIELCDDHPPGTAAYAPLDLMYKRVLTLSMKGKPEAESDRRITEQQHIVGCTVLLFSHLPLTEIGRLLYLSPDDAARAKLVLSHLQSVFTIPTSSNRPVGIIHQSFRDYLIDPERAGKIPKLFVPEAETHRQLFRSCLTLMNASLKRNLCGLSYPGASIGEILETARDNTCPPSLSYACRFWMRHASLADLETEDVRSIHEFLSDHFLHWLEAISLVHSVSDAVRDFTSMQGRLKTSDLPPVQDYLEDARRFMLTFRYIIERAPLQVYSAALQFSPLKSLIRQGFQQAVFRPPYIATTLPSQWSACQQTLEGHTSGVRSVVFSGDGSQVASASYDHTVRLWDAKTGACQQTLEGHTSWVLSVVFSGDGSQVASASDDHTVRLWDAKTGACQQTLEGHTSGVNSVVFSGDGSQVASASQDHTVRLWDAKTGACPQTLEGHTDWVLSVVFSGDGSQVASASDDHTVRLWDAKTGAYQQTLEGHTDGVLSVVFSGDGSQVASASRDRTVRLWDAKTGACQQTLEGHTDGVNSVVFSGDGSQVASASQDHTVRLWDAKTGACQQTLEGHTSRVNSVAFSGDGSQVASASDDHTVRLWDAKTGACQQTLEGHTDWVRSVVFSGDGAQVASASWDYTVRLWDVQTGMTIFVRRCGSSLPQVDFDVDGTHIWIEGERLSLSGADKATSQLHTGSTENTSEPNLHESASTFTTDQSGEWVLYLGQRYLWIPKDFRGRYAAHGKTLVCGGDSGRMTFVFEHDVLVRSLPDSIRSGSARRPNDCEPWMLASLSRPSLYHPFV